MRPEVSSAEPVVTRQLVEQHGLTPDEFERIKKILGREPNFTELGIFSVMWSEHCSYKNSRLELRKFPTSGPNILVKAGEENAGVVDIGDGWAVAFKMESHNHPSAIEPFQGAATGVGGIIRDIFTMGARPEFCLNSLRFGPIARSPKSKISNSRLAANRRLFTGVVSGIAHYGNCVGIPTIGGEIYFGESFLSRSAAPRAVGARHRKRRGQPGLLRRRRNWPRWPGRRGVCLPRIDRTIAPGSPGSAGGRSVQGKTFTGSLPGIDRARRHRRHSGHGRRGTYVFHL